MYFSGFPSTVASPIKGDARIFQASKSLRLGLRASVLVSQAISRSFEKWQKNVAKYLRKKRSNVRLDHFFISFFVLYVAQDYN